MVEKLNFKLRKRKSCNDIPRESRESARVLVVTGRESRDDDVGESPPDVVTKAPLRDSK